jgi:hypothetical protein
MDAKNPPLARRRVLWRAGGLDLLDRGGDRGGDLGRSRGAMDFRVFTVAAELLVIVAGLEARLFVTAGAHGEVERNAGLLIGDETRKSFIVGLAGFGDLEAEVSHGGCEVSGGHAGDHEGDDGEAVFLFGRIEVAVHSIIFVATFTELAFVC